jgi:PTH1 family peptidyl-tRNA hydrolase
MKLIVGLGNPGKNYEKTRHNIGFYIVDNYLGNINYKEKFNGLYYELNIDNEKILFLKPQTYMNNSGECVSKFVKYYNIECKDIMIIHDDLDLNVGVCKFKYDSTSGGHNGIKSIIQHLGTKDVARLKIGIGPQPNLPSEVFVLQNFTKEELETLKPILSKSKDGIECFFKEGIAVAQNKYN